jgi:hypothetical protein
MGNTSSNGFIVGPFSTLQMYYNTVSFLRKLQLVGLFLTPHIVPKCVRHKHRAHKRAYGNISRGPVAEN